MKKIQRLVLALMISMGGIQFAQAQSATTADRVSLVIPADPSNTATQRRAEASTIDLPLPGSKKFKGKINYNKSHGGKQNLAGTIDGISGSTFSLRVDKGVIEGSIVLNESKKAYTYFSNASGTYVQEVALESVVCSSAQKETTARVAALSSTPPPVAPATLKLQSLPGGKGCIFLDFDGHYTAGTVWNGGLPISAAPSGMTEAEIREAYDLVKEDFSPFNLNITTDSTVFLSYPQDFRMRVIITPTTTASPGNTGAAVVNSFKFNDDTPCWVFSLGAKNAGETASHEVGHTLGLRHDGKTGSGAAYQERYTGNDDWAPIMGNGLNKMTTQWSRGDYANANNQENDMDIIASYANGFGYRNDDHGNTKATATPLRMDANGDLLPANNNGILEREGDSDFFVFTPSETGYVSISIRPADRHCNLNIYGRLHKHDGVFNSDMSGTWSGLFAHVFADTTYYVEIFAAEGNNHPTSGNLGYYEISGSARGGLEEVGQKIVTLYNDCNYGTELQALEVGNYIRYDLGHPDNTISSIKVKPGYSVTLYEDDNYRGNSITFSGDDACLIDNAFDNKASSMRIFKGTNRPPYVGISSPDNNEVIYTPATIVLKSNPSDEDGTISKVEFYNGATKLGEATAAPYNYTWSSVAAGTYTITAVATDNLGAKTTSTAKKITVTSFSAAATFYPNCSYGGTAVGLAPGTYNTAQLAAKGISDNDIASVQVSSGYEVILFKENYASNVAKKISSNTSCLSAISFENETSSLVVRPVTPNKAPTVCLVAPYDSTVYNSAVTITLFAAVSDIDGSPNKVEFFDGATLLGTAYYPSTSMNWTPGAGTHSITAKAYDNENASTVSKAVTITVNITPVCTAPEWATGTTYVTGNTVKQGGIKYYSNFWNYNQPPNLNNGPSGSGKPWTSLGTCTSREEEATGALESTQNNNTLTLFPNPGNSYVNLNYETQNAGEITVQITDLLSKTVISKTVDGVTGLNVIELNVSSLENGIYIVSVENGNQHISTKLVVQK